MSKIGYAMGASMAKAIQIADDADVDDQRPDEGRAFFTMQGWENAKRVSNHSVEVKVTFDPTTEKWSAEIVREWKGRF